MTTAIKFREKFPVLNASKSSSLTFNEDLADVVIGVWPSAQSIGSGTDLKQQDYTQPAAKLPAHVAILAAKNKYFKALFSNGMSESSDHSKALCTVNTSDGQNIIAERPKKIVNIHGYSVEAVKYFIGHLYDDSTVCAAQKRETLQEWEELLKLADEYESLYMFEMVSYELMDRFLNDPAGKSNHHVVTLLNIAYGFSKETNQILRKGCWWYFDQNYLKVLGTKDLTHNAKKLVNKELAVDLFLRVLPKVK
ncbi:hypothetical protein DFS34DRAFT_690557 [Phlyctochytrium arcticum]|nr:hypothetical protein DFS34DRAFT_690557 [Phlyctochytrium arcticum]